MAKHTEQERKFQRPAGTEPISNNARCTACGTVLWRYCHTPDGTYFCHPNCNTAHT